jgi:hypothetical protein
MGRYAYFYTDKTSVEYKFWFGIQSTDDIEEFGGEEYRNFAEVDCDGIVADAERNMDEEAVAAMKDDLEELCQHMDDKDNVFDISAVRTNFWTSFGRTGHRWFHSELSDILEILESESKSLEVPLPDWETYTPDNDGVEAMTQWLEEKFKCDSEDQQRKNAHYTLGCVIYLLLSCQPENEPLSVLYDC